MHNAAAMSTNLPLSPPVSKGSVSSNSPSTIANLSGGLLVAERGARRSGLSLSTGIPKASSPRNNQSLRKQNKSSRRPQLAEDMSDTIAVGGNNRKGRTDITHLMNFELPPRPRNPPHQGYAGRGSYRRQTYSWGYNAADKARYIHANYRFIVNPHGNYENLTSVDDHVDWKDVLQVLVSSKSQSTNCPICLSDPISPRMAKCGHIFCLPCLIRYLHSTDETVPIPEKKVRWKKCPICEDTIYISEARPVRWFEGQEGEPPREGTDVVLRLMKRDYDSALALPKESVYVTSPKQDVPWHFAADVMDYARVMKGTENYMQDEYNKEIAAIEVLEKEDELMFGEGTQWTQKAIASIRDARDRIQGIGNPPTAPSFKSREKRPVNETILSDLVSTNSEPSETTKFSRSVSISSVDTQQTTITAASLGHSTQTPGAKRTRHLESLNGSATFFFYQALLHYYLSPLDVRILKTEFGDYSLFPSAVLARVEHVSTGHLVDDDLRKRAKYLGHLPRGCEVGFLECDWTDIVKPETIKMFSVDLDRRRKRNKDKETREEKDRLRAEKEEDDKRLALIRRRRNSTSHGTAASSSIGIPSSSTELRGIDLGSFAASPPWTQSRLGFASLGSPSTSPSGPKTVWGTNMVAPLESPILTAVQVDSENDGWLQGWESDLIRDDDLLAQVQAVSLDHGTPAPGKKKKQKKITLMSTNARRAA